MLAFDRLLSELTDDGEKLALVCSKVEDTFATVFRQIAMYRFEETVHNERHGGELTAERLGEIWVAVQRQVAQIALMSVRQCDANSTRLGHELAMDRSGMAAVAHTTSSVAAQRQLTCPICSLSSPALASGSEAAHRTSSDRTIWCGRR